MSTANLADFTLPSALIGRADVARLEREVEKIDNDFSVQKVRDHAAEGSYQLGTVSRSLNDFLQLNNTDILDDQQRLKLRSQLRVIKKKAPTIHMTFAVEPDPESLQWIAAWLRKEIHPQALVTVGLQPSVIGGVYMRTPNHVHDFTVRALLATKRDVIAKEIDAILSAPVPAPPEATQAATGQPAAATQPAVPQTPAPAVAQAMAVEKAEETAA